ncbi:MAG: molybdate ABC transporter substrate-binding protein [Magnetococcales bacterium]|nr:molybdate ABC transporter substrate-binding protein [Magnetococcales bacterium]
MFAGRAGGWHWLVLFAGLFFPALPRAETVSIAVAANFTAPAKKLAELFSQESGHQTRLSFASTGKLYSQIHNGAPYAVLLAADAETPVRLAEEGLANGGSRFTYALGKLVLWSAKSGYVDTQGSCLQQGNFAHLAIADPKLAPYGRAAQQSLQALGLYERLQAKLVQGENIAQTQQFVASGNAELGFVSLSQLLRDGQLIAGSAWIIPEHLYQEIRQDAILLHNGQANPAATAWLAFLRSDKAHSVIRSFGYGT